MARIARLICVLGVLSLSTSAFAAFIPITDDEPANDAMIGTTILTATRVGNESLFGGGALAIDGADVDYFQFDLLQGDYLMVNTSILDPNFVTTVTLYDNAGAVIPGGAGAAGYIDNASSAATYYVGVTGSGAASYMMTLALDHVPEPATMALLVLGGVLRIKKRRLR